VELYVWPAAPESRGISRMTIYQLDFVIPGNSPR
jgi:hypothetical protein